MLFNSSIVFRNVGSAAQSEWPMPKCCGSRPENTNNVRERASWSTSRFNASFLPIDAVRILAAMAPGVSPGAIQTAVRTG